ncbi:phenazine biosynthesis protein PhzE [Myceligenerans cantabricum]
MSADLLDLVLHEDPPPFALLHRPGAGRRHVVDVLVGDVSRPALLGDISLPPEGAGSPRRPGRLSGAVHDVLALVPYRQLHERGFSSPDDATPLVALTVTADQEVPLGEVLERVPDAPIELNGETFEPDDAAYGDRVRRVVEEEIATGQGANFVLRRTFGAEIGGSPLSGALTLFRRILESEQGSHWTFLAYTGERILVGASPERHVSLRDGIAVMNPISGTYRYPRNGPDLPGVMDFLADRKESEELAMVLDEELKMMARICDDGGRVTGPYLKEMAAVAHTEYFIEGHTSRDPRDILRETLFAPTVTGSPLENACRVISRYEPEGRGYYSGVAALVGRDAAGRRTMDSAILIRTADIGSTGRLALAVGATIVRESRPEAEIAETRAKAEGIVAALRAPVHRAFAAHPDVRSALEERNDGLAGFWLRSRAGSPGRPSTSSPDLTGRRVLMVDAEDTFTAMMVHQLRATGATVVVRRFDEPPPPTGHDLVVLGPGPGDPGDPTSPKMRHLRSEVSRLLTGRSPFLAVCLSHQVLSQELGLRVSRRRRPNQGVQRAIQLFDEHVRVGFYNSFSAVSPTDHLESRTHGRIEVSRDPASGEVHALRGPGLASVQFHPESVLTLDGDRILARLCVEALASALGPTTVLGAPGRGTLGPPMASRPEITSAS